MKFKKVESLKKTEKRIFKGCKEYQCYNISNRQEVLMLCSFTNKYYILCDSTFVNSP